MNLQLKSIVKKLCLSILIVVSANSYSFSQIYINGTTICVQQGVSYTYVIENPIYEQYVWTVTGGQIQGSNTGNSITVIWNSPSCSTPPYSCLGQINIEGQNFIQQWCTDPWGWPEDCSYWSTIETKAINIIAAMQENSGGIIIPANSTIPWWLYSGLYFQTVTYFQTPQDLVSAVSPTGDCNGYTSLQWEQANSSDGPFFPISGSNGLTYHFNGPLSQTTYFRRRVSSASFPDAFSNIVKIEIISVYTENRNYVREHTIVAKGNINFAQVDQLPIGKKFTSTTYLDGMGRPVQKLEKEVSSTASGGWNDIVGHIDYDAAGRTPQSFLPYSSGSNIGYFKPDAATAQAAYIQQQFGETHAYKRVDFDNSPLNRTVKSYEPGANLGGTNVGVTIDYGLNNSNAVEENVRIWRIAYPAGSVPYSGSTDFYAAAQLYKTVITDEYGKNVIEYKDLSGNVVLKKVQDKNEGPDLDQQHKGWVCTYYVYDDFNRLRFIITPKAVEWLKDNNWNLQANPDLVNELCFWNEYDKRGRMIRKKSPGGAFVEMVYDERDRLVYTQDGKQRTQGKWVTSLYDSQDRIVLTGIITYPGQTRDGLQSAVDNINFGLESTNFTVSTDITQSHILSVKGNPLSNPTGLYVLTISYYDYYNYPRVKTFSNNYTIDNTVPADETEDVAKSDLTLGAATGSFVRVMDGTEKFLATTTFYDREGSVIQTHTENYRNTVDINTIQYDFAGRIRSSYTKHQSNLGELNIFNRNILDKIGRVTKITESINGSSAKELVEYTFNELGQVAKKRLAPGFNGVDGPQLETLNYEYNMRGSLTAINKNYINSSLQGGSYFGMELAYEKQGTNFSAARIDGNIAGISWKSRGDNILRKYEYIYDARGQFSQSIFKQKNTAGADWTDDKVNFSTSVVYDINGNITLQYQNGIIPGIGVTLVDAMSYVYDKNGWSNRLLRVDDNLVPWANGKLGDFKDGSNGTGVTDYEYNSDGQVTKDLNKEIGAGTNGIEYNILGMPSKVTFGGTNKTITYTYDAAGNKLKKRVQQSGATVIDITTDYADDFIYENGSLAFFSHAEGRVRVITPVNNGVNYLNGGVSLPGGKQGVYDYYIKDHLTSIRMILTEEQHQTNAIATMELANASQEEAIFGQVGSGNEVAKTRQDKPSAWASNTTQKVSRVSSIGTDNKVGPNVLMRVMAGDMLSAQTNYYYVTNGTYPLGSTILNDVVSSIIGGINSNRATGLIKENAGAIQSGLGLTGGELNNFIQSQGRGRGTQPPKAYMTVLFFDEQFNFVNESSTFVRVQTPGDGAPAINLAAEAPKNGYAIIYLSNESNQYVYFDDFQVTHNRGRIIEESHYYAYGLKIAGISSKAIPSNLGGAQANSRVTYGYQGSYSEEDIDAQWNEFDLRTYDPQIGRWLQIDPYDEFVSGYIGMGNNPISNVDPTGGFIDPPTVLAQAVAFAKLHNSTVTLMKTGQLAVTYWTSTGTLTFKIFGEAGKIAATQGVIYRVGTILTIAPHLVAPGSLTQNLNMAAGSTRVNNIAQYKSPQYDEEQLKKASSNFVDQLIEDVSWDMAGAINQRYNYFTGNWKSFASGSLGEDLSSFFVPGSAVLKGLSRAKIIFGATKATPRYLYHYTNKVAAQNISKVGLQTKYSSDGFLYLTNKGNLSPLQAQIELALPANRALPNSLLRVDTKGLSPSIIRRVQGNLPGMGAGGGTEFLFNQNIPASAIKIIN